MTQLNTRSKEIQLLNRSGSDLRHHIRPQPSHLQINIYVKTATESEVRPYLIALCK